MTQPLSRRGVVAAAATAGLASPYVARAIQPFRLRCSLDTAPTHMRNITIGDYLQKLETGSGGQIKTELFHAGALFADVNVGKALLQGQVEMACPGSWLLTGFVPDCDVVNLPVLYSQPIEICRRVMDGKSGAHINAQLQTKLRARVLGLWLQLGFQHWYSATKPIKVLADVAGMKIRILGGAAMAWRTRFFGANPNTTAWPDVPLALSQGTFDGLITTNESAFSAKLWEAGLKTSVQDRQNVDNYIPMVSEAFLHSLPKELQALLVDTWEQNVAGYRTRMLAAQDRALAELVEHGVVYAIPPDDEIAAVRRRMLAEQPKLVKELRLSAELPRLLAWDLRPLA
jgi:C4-dicarboxylate-binding protein DctP